MLGEEVLVLEKAPELGGTGIKAAFLCWVPNNRWLLQAGIEDPEADFLRFAARTARPEKYDPESPTLGQSPMGVRGVQGDLRERKACSRAPA